MFRILAVLGAAMMLVGCATVPPPTLGVSDFQKYRIAEVVVEGVEVIRSWPREEELFQRTNPVDAETARRMQTEPASTFPALRAHIQHALNERFRSEITSQAGPIFTGKRPLRAIVQLKIFDIPSVGRRVFIDNDAKMKATIVLVDAATGAPVLSYEGPLQMRRMVGGVLTGIAVAFERSDIGYSLITDYINAYRNWLLQS